MSCQVRSQPQSNLRVYSFQGNTKLHAKYMKAIFGDQFYRQYILKISKN